jgi:hypothetical protein
MNVLLEVHYGDREELGPLEPPVSVAVDPVVLRGSRPSPWSVMVHGVVYDDDLTLHQPDRTSTRSRVLPTPPAGLRSPTRTSRPCSSRWPPSGPSGQVPVNLPAPPVPPHHAQPVDLPDQPLPSEFDHSLSVKLLFRGTTSKNFSLIPSSWYYLPKIPITAVI